MRHTAILITSILLISTSHAIVDKDNMGRWTKPTNSRADKDVPGFLVNLGPTGARAILKETSLVVKYVFPNTPADGKLEIDDEIIGANGKEFTTKHIFGMHYFKNHDKGYEGPMMDFGNAIEESEGLDGTMVLDVMRGGKNVKVLIQIPKAGRFSKTYPVNCRKSDKLVADALEYILKDPDRFKGPVHEKGTIGLALLAHGRLGEARELAQQWNTVPGPNTWTWPVSYQCIFLGEYYLKTKDPSVLKTIEGLVARLYEGQVIDTEKYKDWMHSGQPNGNNFLHGGLGHAVKIDGYGTMTITTLLAMTAWELAKECGVKVDQQRLDFAYACIKENTGKDGYMGYRFATGKYSGVGRQGLSIIVHKMSGMENSDPYIALVSKHLGISKTRLNDGHGDNVLSLFWGLVGVQASQNMQAIREQLDYNKALINLARTHDGSFVALPGRNNGDKGYYVSSRLHFTAAMTIILSMDEPTLRVQGARE